MSKKEAQKPEAMREAGKTAEPMCECGHSKAGHNDGTEGNDTECLHEYPVSAKRWCSCSKFIHAPVEAGPQPVRSHCGCIEGMKHRPECPTMLASLDLSPAAERAEPKDDWIGDTIMDLESKTISRTYCNALVDAARIAGFNACREMAAKQIESYDGLMSGRLVATIADNIRNLK